MNVRYVGPLTIGGVLVVGIFLLDLLTAPQLAVGMLYMLPVLVTLWLSSRWTIAAVIVCVALEIVGLLATPLSDWTDAVIINRAVAVAMTLSVAVICLQRYEAHLTVERNRAETIEHAEALEASNKRMRVEIKQRERVERELRQSNQELQRFAYVASHDLQTPLRTVTSYLDLLQRRHGEQLNEEAREYIAEAIGGAAHMRQLITDLLQLARVNTRARAFAPVDLNRVLQRVLQNLAAAIKAAGATIDSETLPTLPADEGQFVQLFQNLLENSLKYRSERPPRIQISARESLGEWIISVEDNGMGIDPKHADDIFDIFRRLHGPQTHPGTGIGLSLCRSIVVRHGGRIWLDKSTPGDGSRFCFTVPTEPSVT